MSGDREEPTAKVVVELDVVDGWPPVSSERLWAFELGGDRYRIDNVPWFARDLAVGDVVRAVAPDAESHPVLREVLDRSDHLTLRLVVLRRGPLAGDLGRALERFKLPGVYAEGAEQFGMLALDVEASADLDVIAATLRAGVGDGSWEYDEGRITAGWVAATQPPPEPASRSLPQPGRRRWARRPGARRTR